MDREASPYAALKTAVQSSESTWLHDCRYVSGVESVVAVVTAAV